MIYRILDKPESAEILGCWEKHLGGFKEVIGYSATGAIFLKSPETNEFLALYPSMPGSNSKNYGVFSSIKEFENTILKDGEFPNYCLYPISPEDLPNLEKALGKLGSFEVYFPALPPSLGGSLELDTFMKGNVWVRTDIFGQNMGL